MTVVTTGWEVFEDLRAAQDEMLRAGWGRARRHGQQYDADAGALAWAPVVEISERKDAYLVSAELPGVSAGEVEITFGDGLLTIQGERHASRDAGAGWRSGASDATPARRPGRRYAGPSAATAPSAGRSRFPAAM